MLDLQFLKTVEELYAPSTGTEMMAPILYYLIRSTRPQHVLEYGAGYSTPFILKALADNLSDYKSEIKALKSKNSSFSKSISSAEFDAWCYDKGVPFYDPQYYMIEYKPQLICFEKLPKSHSYTQKVLGIINKLDLHKFLTFIEGSACGQSRKISEQYLPIDLAWNDDDSYYKFFSEYWDLINSDGGSILFHNTINAHSSVISEMKKIKKKLEAGKDYELVNIVEPHKLDQRSFTLIKKTTKSKEVHYNQPIHQKEIYNNFLTFINKFKD